LDKRVSEKWAEEKQRYEMAVALDKTCAVLHPNESRGYRQSGRRCRCFSDPLVVSLAGLMNGGTHGVYWNRLSGHSCWTWPMDGIHDEWSYDHTDKD
jgi:hypothetical protein